MDDNLTLKIGTSVPTKLSIGSPVIVEIESSGKVTLFGEPNEAARIFWTVVEKSNPVLSRVDKLEEENKEIKTALLTVLELIDELRGYTHDWDWKYGKDWDNDRKNIVDLILKVVK